MKGEMLFRGARVCDGKLVNGSLVMVKENDESEKYIPNIVISYGPDTFDWFEVDPETVGQYTGLNAKKKKINLSEKIFEGDIFRGLNDNDIEKYYVVMWIEQRAAFYMVPADHYCVLKDNDLSNDDDFNWLFDDAMLYDFSSDCSLTKVGNIHDNKDLLK